MEKKKSQKNRGTVMFIQESGFVSLVYLQIVHITMDISSVSRLVYADPVYAQYGPIKNGCRIK